MKTIIRNRATLSLLLSLVMTSQVGCSSIKASDDTYYSVVEDSEDDALEDGEIVEELTEDENEKANEEELSSVEILRRNEVADNYVNYFDSYEVNYNYQEYFITEEEVKTIYEEQNKEVSCNFINNDNIFTLYDKVMKNSFEYLESHPEYDSCFIDVDTCYDVELIEQACRFENIFYLVLKEHFKDSTNDLDEDVCRMQDLKIVYDDNASEELSGWYDNDENVIGLCRANIIRSANDYLLENDITLNDIYDDCYDYDIFMWDYYFYPTLSHEFEHMFQNRCNCVEDVFDAKDVLSYSMYNDEDYYVSLLSESSAESAFINFLNDDYLTCYDENDEKIEFDNFDYSYVDYRKIESLFILMALFNESVTINDYYSALGNADINALLDFFDMNTEDGRYTFYKLLYIADGVNGRSDLVSKYESEKGTIVTYGDLDNYEADMGSGYRAEMFKIVLSRLVEYTKNNTDFTFKENLMLFNFIKDNIVDGASFYEDVGTDFNFVYDDKFVFDVVTLEGEYINFLSDYYGLSSSLVRDIDLRYSSESNVIFKLLVDGEDTRYYESDNCNVALALLERFPLMRPIVDSCEYIIGYNSFSRSIENNLIYSSGKSLKLVNKDN